MDVDFLFTILRVPVYSPSDVAGSRSLTFDEKYQSYKKNYKHLSELLVSDRLTFVRVWKFSEIQWIKAEESIIVWPE